MTNAIPGLEQFYAFNDALLGAPVGIIVFILCLALGYGLKITVWLENRLIPRFVLVSGTVLFPLLSDPAPGTPWRVWLVKHLAVGFIVACLAWAFHNKLLKRVEDRFGLFNDSDSTPPQP